MSENNLICFSDGQSVSLTQRESDALRMKVLRMVKERGHLKYETFREIRKAKFMVSHLCSEKITYEIVLSTLGLIGRGSFQRESRAPIEGSFYLTEVA